jgi:hypothetical protein
MRARKLFDNSVTRGEAPLTRLWLAAVAARRRRAGRVDLPEDEEREFSPAQEDLVRRYAPGRSFADIGCLWRADGAVAFLAEECGATGVTAFDEREASDLFRERHTSRDSGVRFVRGDLHDDDSMREVGSHDVVWCTGVMYHTPNPVLAIERLRALSSEYLIIGNKTIPEIPGFPGGAVYFPGLTEKERAAYAPLGWGGDTLTFKHQWSPYSNWWWGLTPSSMRGILETPADWVVEQMIELPWSGRFDNLLIVARRTAD